MKYQPAYGFILCFKSPLFAQNNKCFTSEEDALSFVDSIQGHADYLYLYYPDGQRRNLTQKAAS